MLHFGKTTTTWVSRMDKLEDLAIIILYAVAAISGGLGGCAVTAQQFLRTSGGGQVQMRISWIMAYSIIGAVFGLLFAAYGVIFVNITSYADIVGPALISGIVGASSLGLMNVSARIILKQLGVEIEVTMRRESEERRMKPEDRPGRD